jgi:PIN domain
VEADMLRLLIDTCVWLDMAKDYRHRPTIEALEQMIDAKEVSLALPRQAVDEFARNKERIIRESGKSLSSTFKRVGDAVRQFGKEEGKDKILAYLSDIDHRITILGEAVNESIQRIERLFAAAEIIEPSDAVKLRAAQRAVDKQAPFHKGKNSMGDALLIEVYRDVLAEGREVDEFAFVTHNKHDFSNTGVDERKQHPDIEDLFIQANSTYALALGEALNQYAPELVDELKWEFEYQNEPRRLSEILEAEHLLFRQVWYNRHWNLRHQIQTGKVRLVPDNELSRSPYRQDEISKNIWNGALAAAKRTEDEVGRENLGPWDDFEWGMINGKLSALRWVTGDDWDMLDT